MEEPAPGAPALPASLQRLWGMDRGSRPGQRPSLDVRGIAAAAIALADENGLAAVSMARVASSLGVTTMALYRYVASKEELLELMLEVGAGDPPSLEPDLGWREALTAWAHNLAGIYRAHPWAVDVPVPGPPRGPHQLAWAEQGMACLRDTGLGQQERLAIVMLLLVYVRGHESLAQQLARGRGAAGASEEEADRAYEAFAATLDPARFPELHAVWNSGAEAEPVTGAGADRPADEPLDETEFGLARILDGVELLVRRRRRTPRDR